MRITGLDKNAKYSLDKAKRFSYFRKKFIAKTQAEAATKLGVHQALISFIEKGKRPITFDMIDRMIKDYNLNSDWLLADEGDPQSNIEEKKTAKNSLQAAHTDINHLLKTIKILHANINHYSKVMSMMDAKMEKMEERIYKLENPKKHT